MLVPSYFFSILGLNRGFLQDELQFQDGFEVIAGIGCALCAFFVFLTFFILLVLWRKISGAITALKIQVCIALIGAYATILKALHESLTKEYYPYVISLIQFFLLAAFSMQLCVGLTVYMEFVDMKGVRYPELKLATMGWAIPMIVVGATLAAQVPMGFRLNSWWIQMQTNYFYAYSISVIIITVLQIMLVTTVKSELKVHKKLETSKHSKSVNRSRLLNRSLVIILFLLLVSVSSIMYINFDDELYKYAFSSSSGVLAHSLCSSTHTIEDDDVKQEPRMKTRSGSFQSFLKPEIVSDSYVSSKIPETIEVDVRMEKLRKLRFQMCPEEIEWKEVDHLLVEKSAAAAASIVRDFTVHHQSSPLIVSKAKEATGIGTETGEKGKDPEDANWTATQESDESVSSPFQLQQLDDSPRSSQFHIKDVQDMGPDGQESQTQFYELGVMQNTPPDILEPTKQAYYTINNSSNQQVIVNPCLSTFCGGGEIGEQCVINTRKASDQCALVSEGLRTSSYSTFRPPANPPSSTFQSPLKSIKEDEKKEGTSFLQTSDKTELQKPPPCRSKTPSPSVKPPISDKPVALRNPDIGDEPIVPADSTLKKKDILGLQVPTPVVPSLDKDSSNTSDTNAQPSSKKGWSITTV
ncbi:uncharacterized protein TNIN_431861 [Trichonephila inaurata madagascariensis]|uniref:Uncharacterized protein n=1 Tax=Trichonephila inaurata madagascariensis TaxID=2747483 RepID=A0A8X7BTI8_9ARAC|nr:uncharacterized protein TNIN_431861 [Trichonephila inaurata madagascariensis]